MTGAGSTAAGAAVGAGVGAMASEGALCDWPALADRVLLLVAAVNSIMVMPLVGWLAVILARKADEETERGMGDGESSLRANFDQVRPSARISAHAFPPFRSSNIS